MYIDTQTTEPTSQAKLFHNNTFGFYL